MEALEHAYRVGNHERARALANLALREPGDPLVQQRAREILTFTEPDPFLAIVGALGLGLVAWLVYNYVP